MLIMRNVTHLPDYSHTYPIMVMMIAHALACALAALGTQFWQVGLRYLYITLQQMWLSLSLMVGVHYTSSIANGGMMCEYVNRRCKSSNTVTATSLLIIMDNVGAVLALICGSFAVQV